jgi:hypothetical protein
MSHYGEPLINDVLINHIHGGMKLLYKESYELNKNDPIIVFQVALSKIKDISQTNLEEEYKRLLNRVENHGNDEEFIERMFELIYKNTTKYLMETEKGYIVDNVHEIPSDVLNIPSNKFKTLHLFTLESARGLYTKANLYYNGYPKEDQEKNYEHSKAIIRNCIIKCVKRRVNLNTLYDYFEQKYNNESSSEEEIIDYHDHIIEENLELQETPLPVFTGGNNNESESESESEGEKDQRKESEKDQREESESVKNESESEKNESEKDQSESESEKEEIKEYESKTEKENNMINFSFEKHTEPSSEKIISKENVSSSEEENAPSLHEEKSKEDDIKHIKVIYESSSESEKDDNSEQDDEKSNKTDSTDNDIDISDVINELKD